MKKTISISLIGLFLIAGCEKDLSLCGSYIELTDHNHLVEISPLKGVPEFLDTLEKYPQLQVYEVIADQYVYGMRCNVFYKGIKVFSDNYQIYKSRRDNSFSGDSAIVDTMDISLVPSIQFDKAISIAKQDMNFDNTCISYRLGIYDLNAGTSNKAKNYKLIWKIQGNRGIGYPYVLLDANSGQVYRKDDGVRV